MYLGRGEGVHLYGYVFTGIDTSRGRIVSFVPLSCDSHYLKTKGLTQGYQHHVQFN